MKKIGILKTYTSNEIEDSYVSIGFECLDRDLFNPEKCYDMLQKTGVKYARCQTGWAKCEKEKGVYDFSWLDSITDNLIRRGIKPWFNVGFGNPIYMDNVPNETAVGCVPLFYGDETVNAWKNYIHALTEHFSSRVQYYEIWNEANIEHFWYPQKPSGKKYAELVNMTAHIIRTVQPDSKIIINISHLDAFDYADEFLSHAEKSAIDVYAFHVYTNVPEFKYCENIWQLRKLLDEHGFENVDLWQGEGGHPSWAYKGHWLVKNGVSSEYAQAVWQLRRYFLDVFFGMKRSSFFQMADMWEKPYAKAVELIQKPAAHGILNGLTYTPKESYRTITNLSAIFSGNIKPAAHYITVDIDTNSLTELISCRSMSYDKNNTPVYAYYLPTSVLKSKNIDYNTEIRIIDSISDPVLIDPYTSDVYQIDEPEKMFGLTIFKNLPIKNYPLIITDKSAFEICCI